MSQKKEAKPQTQTLLQAVFVLGVNSRMKQETGEEAKEKRGSQKPSVTLLVTADQAEQIAHAENLGEIVLTLRNDLDVNFTPLAGVDIEDLRRKLEIAKVVRTRSGTVQVAKKCMETTIVQGDEKKVILVDPTTGIPCT